MMLTRCPACQTVFRLQPEQLHARRGEVRCGHCFHPFNALENEVPAPAGRPSGTQEATGREAASGAATPGAPAPEHAPRDDRMATETGPRAGTATDEPTRKATTKTDTSLDFEIPEGPDPAAAPADDRGADFGADFGDNAGDEPGLPDSPSAPIETLPDAGPDARPGPTVGAPEVIRSGRRTPAPAATSAPAAREPAEERDQDKNKKDDTRGDEGAEAAPAVDSAAPEAEAEAEANKPTADSPQGAMREPLISAWAQKQTAVAHAPRAEKAEAPPAPKPSAAHIPRQADVERLDSVYGAPPRAPNPVLRTLAGLAVGLLAGALAAQAIYLFRVEISRELPGLRPLLVAACAELGCDVPLPRQAEHIGIDASELQSEPGRAGRYTLHVTLKNRATYPIEWPHLELTLTDAGDTPLARRVITPQEWVPLERRKGGFSARDTLSVRLPFENSGPSPTGYRVYVFYP